MPEEKWTKRNWDHFKKSEKTLKHLGPQMKSRYMAYEEPTKDIAAAQANSQKRIVEKRKTSNTLAGNNAEEQLGEHDKHEKLVGQLKAAEARNRIRIMRLRYESNRGDELHHLISCQPSALKAVRLQALVPAKNEERSVGENMDKLEKTRVEALLDDSQGLLVSRS